MDGMDCKPSVRGRPGVSFFYNCVGSDCGGGKRQQEAHENSMEKPIDRYPLTRIARRWLDICIINLGAYTKP